MTEKQAYKIWSPSKNPWTRWTKPVAFMNLGDALYFDPELKEIELDITYSSEFIYIVDLPDSAAISYGLAFAKKGYQPVCLFNGSNIQSKVVTVPNHKLYHAIKAGAEILKDIKIYEKANPVFLLDDRRLGENAPVAPGYFDNRWSIFKQDFPTAEYLLSKKITRVYVVKEKQNIDLQHILYDYQKNGLKIYDGLTKELLKIKKPSAVNSITYRTGVIFGLKRNAAGGFGAMLPDVYDSGIYVSTSRGRHLYRSYYRIG
ncbi:hypothetical protein [Acholeplasma hippikon]|uniref:Uncharacterized protein n=1 Tax=Acholeplasma hippikon TaxID=264636 RepID=A0A449BI50_9MOLU|nr:hypothetical protein [Acholeplasma hippikon]VEU82112.1 Uncharacterised protein [Acholeplasma hippikon]